MSSQDHASVIDSQKISNPVINRNISSIPAHTIPPMPPNFPTHGINSGLLDRVKRFLPEIAMANEVLEDRIKHEGIDAVQIDRGMAQKFSDQENCKVSSIPTLEEHNSDSSEEETEYMGSKPMVELSFALGDFDDSNIAFLEKLNDSDSDSEVEKEVSIIDSKSLSSEIKIQFDDLE